jgi:hypothetical protein
MGTWRKVRRAIDCNFQSAPASFRNALCGGVIESFGPRPHDVGHAQASAPSSCKQCQASTCCSLLSDEQRAVALCAMRKPGAEV